MIDGLTYGQVFAAIAVPVLFVLFLMAWLKSIFK